MIAAAVLRLDGKCYYPGEDIPVGFRTEVCDRLTRIGLVKYAGNQLSVSEFNPKRETAEKKYRNRETRRGGNHSVNIFKKGA